MGRCWTIRVFDHAADGGARRAVHRQPAPPDPEPREGAARPAHRHGGAVVPGRHRRLLLVRRGVPHAGRDLRRLPVRAPAGSRRTTGASGPYIFNQAEPRGGRVRWADRQRLAGRERSRWDELAPRAGHRALEHGVLGPRRRSALGDQPVRVLHGPLPGSERAVPHRRWERHDPDAPRRGAPGSARSDTNSRSRRHGRVRRARSGCGSPAGGTTSSRTLRCSRCRSPCFATSTRRGLEMSARRRRAIDTLAMGTNAKLQFQLDRNSLKALDWTARSGATIPSSAPGTARTVSPSHTPRRR